MTKKKGKSPLRGVIHHPLLQLPTAESADVIMKKALSLPVFTPGIVITVPLSLWPAYQGIYHLETHGMGATGIVLVKRVEANDAKKEDPNV